jgi:integrase
MSERVLVGLYNPRLPPKSLEPVNGEFSFAAAQKAAQGLALEHAQAKPIGGLRKQRERLELARRQAERDAAAADAAQKAALQSEALAEAARQRYTLRALCEQYVAHLKSSGKAASAYDANNIFQNHLFKRAPALANAPAAGIEAEPLTDLLRALNEGGIGRTANKLRSYLGSAYNHALRARFDPSVPLAFKSFGVTLNPIKSTFRIKGADADAKNPLTLAELRRYWEAISDIPGVEGATLRLHVLTGGQRIAQLLRASKASDFGDRLRLLDTKGKREKPREHFVPLLPEARAELDFLLWVNPGQYLFSTTKGAKSVNPMTLTNWAGKAAARAGIADFDAKRVRSGVETLLASRRISSDVRAQLQSHGLGGVQQRHYDGHDYHAEKLHALQTLMEALQGTPAANVFPLEALRAAA